ncbi:Cytochrome c biogenesis factor [Serratia fonticola]|uniref:Cytochrome c biogenesis factor n=1 Tax=Serratia fonticola TaxID=47917 RepID=A0A4U9VQI5_SERFO|nr:Cytochrome c biogenesis factor [Serratia fonticola]
MADNYSAVGRCERGCWSYPRCAKAKKVRRPAADTLNKAFYQDRLDELAQDEDQGVVAERPELVKELQQNLLNDIPGQPDEQPARPINRWALVPGVMVLVVVSVGFYLKTGGLAQVMAWHQVESQMPELRARVANERAQPLSMEESCPSWPGFTHLVAAR